MGEEHLLPPPPTHPFLNTFQSFKVATAYLGLRSNRSLTVPERPSSFFSYGTRQSTCVRTLNGSHPFFERILWRLGAPRLFTTCVSWSHGSDNGEIGSRPDKIPIRERKPTRRWINKTIAAGLGRPL